MAQHRGRQGEWPIVKGNPDAFFLTPDGYRKSDRSLVGPLRMGTAPGVGPRGEAVATGRDESRSDMGMDRVSPREFDPMGTSLDRYKPNQQSDLISREIRGGSKRRED